MMLMFVDVNSISRDPRALEPEGWHRSNYGATYRRRPNCNRDEEYVAF